MKFQRLFSKYEVTVNFPTRFSRGCKNFFIHKTIFYDQKLAKESHKLKRTLKVGWKTYFRIGKNLYEIALEKLSPQFKFLVMSGEKRLYFTTSDYLENKTAKQRKPWRSIKSLIQKFNIGKSRTKIFWSFQSHEEKNRLKLFIFSDWKGRNHLSEIKNSWKENKRWPPARIANSLLRTNSKHQQFIFFCFPRSASTQKMLKCALTSSFLSRKLSITRKRASSNDKKSYSERR